MTDSDCGNVVRGRTRALAAGFFAAAVLTCTALGQDFIAQANALYDDIIPSRRSDPIVLPALMGLEAPPVGVDTPERAALAFVGSKAWDAAAAWAEGETQQAMLSALEQGTRGTSYDTAMAFAQPYGVEGVDIDLIRGGMYTELGDPPLLADARHLYMEKFDDLRCLVHVEATRLAGEGEQIRAMEQLTNLAQFGYQMADREFLAEAKWGYRTMAEAIARIRDIAYVDFQAGGNIDPSGLKEVIARLDPGSGPIRLDRLRFPRANRIAAQQLIMALYKERGGVDESVFASTMVRLSTGDRPLRRFSASSYFERLAGSQKDWYDIDDVNRKIFESWERKWDFGRFDPVRALPFEWDQGLAGEEALVVREGVGGNMGVLYELRTLVELERVGTRQSLGLLGRFYEQGQFAPRIDGIRPRWVERLEDDPLNSNRMGGRVPPMRYFRPVTDFYVANERVEPQPHRMQVFPGDGTNFEVVLGEDQFLVYSTGGDGRDNSGIRMSGDPESLVGDYLIWPPLLSLHRTHLRQIGELE